MNRRGGCGRRALLVALVLFALGACAVAALTGLAMRTPAGRYYGAVGLLVGGFDQLAERVATRLVEDRPSSEAAYYGLLAAAQRRQGQSAAMLETLDSAVEALPGSWDAHSDRCWYGTLFDAADTVMDSCETAVAGAGDRRHLAAAHARHGVALARAGQLDAGRMALDRAFDVWAEAGVDPDRFDQPWSAWRNGLEAGNDPFDEATLERERQRF